MTSGVVADDDDDAFLGTVKLSTTYNVVKPPLVTEAGRVEVMELKATFLHNIRG